MSEKSTARRGRADSMRVSGWPLRWKVALALTIPLVVAATFGGVRVRDDLIVAENSSSSAEQVTILRPAVDYLTASEQAMVAAQGSTAASRADLKTALQAVQVSAEELQSTRDTAGLTAEQRYQVDAMLDLSRALRDGNTDELSPGTWVAQLRLLQSGVTQLVTTIVNEQLTPEPRLELLSQTLSGRFSLAMQQTLVAGDRSGDTGSLELFAELGVEGAAIDRLASALGDSEPAVSALRTENAERSRTVRTGGDDLGGVEAFEEYNALANSLLDGIDTQLAASAESARTRALVNAGITLAALLAAILLAFLISRMLLTPIRKVREGALKLAHEQLPEAVARIRAGEDPGEIEPIDVTTQEEIGQLARAVDDMHRQAVHLAAGEAHARSQVSDMFVTLSRRSTSLINQQLALIETLEKDEEDPRRLDSLFRLDHLAARMRRTSDSLLILADAPTADGIAHQLSVADALQAATSGVQDYQRVRVDSTDTTTRIDDAAAADVVHLLTELVDNALSFSPPTAAMSLRSVKTPGGVAIEVMDAGLGIPEQTLAELNETLRSGGDVTPDTARRMGLFVVSRLARKHGITASLRRNSVNGTTATVILPDTLLQDMAAEPKATVESSVPRTASTPRTPPAAETTRRPGLDPTPVREEAARASSLSAMINANASLPTRQPNVSPDREELPRRGEQSPAPAPAELSEPVTTPTAEGGSTTAMADTDFLTGDLPPEAVSGAGGGTPIFGELRSAWLSADGAEDLWRSSEIEEGWDRADLVAEAPSEASVGGTGLPMRRPGTRLVPGGVQKNETVAARDPEAIRARLSAHAAGVARGRSAAATSPEPEFTEEGPA